MKNQTPSQKEKKSSKDGGKKKAQDGQKKKNGNGVPLPIFAPQKNGAPTF